MDIRSWLTKPLVLAAVWVIAVAGVATAGVFAVQASSRSAESQDLEAQLSTMEASTSKMEAAEAKLVAVAAESQATAEDLAARVEELEGKVARLERAKARLERLTAELDAEAGGSPACSAAELASEPVAQAGLPAAVAEMRRQILTAATNCDLDGLASLAGPGFTYSFGGGEDPASSWRDAEDRGEKPLWFLVKILNLPQAVVGSDYVWPSAFGYGDWSDVPAAAKEAVGAIYGAEDLAGFAELGFYAGYRVGITPAGVWTFFVAGD